jgi:hypothetical protein
MHENEQRGTRSVLRRVPASAASVICQCFGWLHKRYVDIDDFDGND